MPSSMIEIERLTKSFGPIQAVAGIDLNVAKEAQARLAKDKPF